MRLRAAFLLFLLLPFLAGPVRADDYEPASWPNLLRTMIRFNALDLSDTRILDEYGMITECRLYNSFYKDDFKWHQVRDAMQNSIKINLASFPTSYRYDLTMQLDRYDFAAKLFRFKEKSTIRNVNTFVIYTVEGGGCGSTDIKFTPRSFHAVISTPISMEGIPLAEKDAEALLKHMGEQQNDKRLVYARFNLRVLYIAPWKEAFLDIKDKSSGRYQQSDALPNFAVRLDARLDTISFYEDPERTKLIFQY